MTQKEKEWIIKIQLLQLQTDNPYEDDYYYAVSFNLCQTYYFSEFCKIASFLLKVLGCLPKNLQIFL
jgi:hypothetical protein